MDCEKCLNEVKFRWTKDGKRLCTGCYFDRKPEKRKRKPPPIVNEESDTETESSGDEYVQTDVDVLVDEDIDEDDFVNGTVYFTIKDGKIETCGGCEKTAIRRFRRGTWCLACFKIVSNEWKCKHCTCTKPFNKDVCRRCYNKKSPIEGKCCLCEKIALLESRSKTLCIKCYRKEYNKRSKGCPTCFVCKIIGADKNINGTEICAPCVDTCTKINLTSQ